MGHTTGTSGLTVSLICPTDNCGARVEVASRRFHGAPALGTCANCGATLTLAAGHLDAGPPRSTWSHGSARGKGGHRPGLGPVMVTRSASPVH